MRFGQTFLDSTLIFAKKMSVKGERGAYDNDNRIFTIVGMSTFVEKFFKRIPAFWQKNVRCTVERVHDTVNKNFTFLEVSICPKNVRLV